MEYISCKNCILHSGIPNVTVSKEDNLCSVCSEHTLDITQEKRIYRYFTNKMNVEIERVKKHNYACDALVLFSGGKDSTFLIKMMKEKYKLNVVAFSVIHPLVNEIAARNIEQVAEKLDIELVKFFPRKSEYCRLIKYALLHTSESYPNERIGCDTCSYIFKNAALIYAIKNNIPLVFDGTDRAQNETPIYIDGIRMKEKAEKGEGPFDPMHKIAMEALGNNYKGTIYDFDYNTLRNYTFPSYIAPFTFLDYKFQDSFSEFELMGLEKQNFKTVITNCDAVPFFSYFSLKRYDCLTYVKHYANEIRKQSPYFNQSKMEYQSDESALPRETIQEMIKEYKEAVYYAVEHKLNSFNISQLDKENLKGMTPTYQCIYGTDVCEVFLEQIIKINEYAEFFDIDLMKIGVEKK